MSGVLVAPTEPTILKAIGVSSSIPEKAGVDVMWPAFDGLVGVQRKEVGDLFSSVSNGRLNTELAKARGRLKVTWLLIEGTMHWNRDGRLGGTLGIHNGRWTQSAWWNFLSGIQASGVFVAFTENLFQTVAWVEKTVNWSLKAEHRSLMTRPNPQGKWGTATSREWLVHLLCSFEGVSAGRALAILEMYPVPLQWAVTEEQLRQVKGIGPKLARSLTQALNGGKVTPT